MKQPLSTTFWEVLFLSLFFIKFLLQIKINIKDRYFNDIEFSSLWTWLWYYDIIHIHLVFLPSSWHKDFSSDLINCAYLMTPV